MISAGMTLNWSRCLVILLQCELGLPRPSSKSYISRLGVKTHRITNRPVAQSKIQVYKKSSKLHSTYSDVLFVTSQLFTTINLCSRLAFCFFLFLSALKSCTNKCESLISSTTAVIFGPLTIETRHLQHIRQTLCADIIRIIIHNVNIRRLARLIYGDLIDQMHRVQFSHLVQIMGAF